VGAAFRQALCVFLFLMSVARPFRFS